MLSKASDKFYLMNVFFMRNTSDTNYVDFPQQAILSFSTDIKWVSYNLVQF